jgi:hypothetical protein
MASPSFLSSFIENVLLEDVQHVNLFLKLTNVQVTYGILTNCLV